MESCNLCEHKYDKLFKTGEKLLGTQLGNVIKLLLADHQVEIPPKFLICTECSLALIHAEIVLKRLSNAFSCTRNCQDNQVKAQSNVEQECQKSKNVYNSTKEGQNEIVCDLDKYFIDLKFNCTYCEYTTTKPKLYKKHLITKHEVENPRIYQCPHCTMTYQRSNGIRNHISFVHGNKPRPKRQRRKTIAVDTPALLSSTSLHNEVDNDTSEANKTYDFNQVNGENLPYEFDCAHCKYKTVHSKWFKTHLQVKHQVEDSRIYKCKQCPSTYIRQFALQNHIAYEHEHKPRPKPQRRKSIATVLELNTTIDNEFLMPDTDLKIEHNSDEETQEFDNNNQIAIISANKTADEQQNKEELTFQAPEKRKRNQLSSSETSTSEWVFQCSNCNFESGKKKKYKTHLSTQHGINDSDIYKCPYCSASYERYSLLQSHVTHKHTIDLTALNDMSGIDSSQENLEVHSKKKQKIEETPRKSKEFTHNMSGVDFSQENLKVRSKKKQKIEETPRKSKEFTHAEFSQTRKRKTNKEKDGSNNSFLFCGKQKKSLDKLQA